MTNTYKVILIGLDGATWDIVEKGIKTNKLTTFRVLIEEGVWGKLKSTIPPVSPSAWTSIFTGVNPGKHGIFGFVKEDKTSHFLVPISSKDRKCEPIWKILSENGKRVIAMNIPFSYPPDKVNGIMSSGLGTPSVNSDFTYPPSFKDRILRKFPDFDVDFDEELLADKPDKLINKIKKVTKAEIELSKYLLENEDWDLFIFVFRALDVIQHFFWNKLEIILEFYQMFDNLLGYIIKTIINKNENIILFVCSDHGFNNLHTLVYLNNWLESLGLFTYKKNSKGIRNKVIKAEKIQKILLKLGFKRFTRILKRNKILRFLLKIVPSESIGYIYRIDWSKTKAYFSEATYGIHINTSNKKEYAYIREYIIREAHKLVDPLTNEMVFKRIYKKEDLYRGPCAKDSPDIVLLKKEGYRFVGGYNEDGNIFVRSLRETGDHNEENGILIVYGNGIKRGYIIEEANVYDILPTVLHILQLPIPAYVDGKVLKDIFKEDSSLVKEPVYCSINDDEKERIRRRIKELKIHHKI